MIIRAPQDGLFFLNAGIGDFVERGAPLGFVGHALVAAPLSGRIVGTRRAGHAVVTSEPIVEIARSRAAQPAGVDQRGLLTSRGVAFAIEMEFDGLPPPSFEGWFST